MGWKFICGLGGICIKTYKFFPVLAAIFLLFIFSVPIVITHSSTPQYAVYGENLTFIFQQNEGFGFQDTYLPYLVYFNMSSGTFNSTNTKIGISYDHQGFITFKSLEDCVLTAYSPINGTRLYRNNYKFNGVAVLKAGETMTIKWIFPPLVAPQAPSDIQGFIGTMLPYLLFIGLVAAVLVLVKARGD